MLLPMHQNFLHQFLRVHSSLKVQVLKDFKVFRKYFLLRGCYVISLLVLLDLVGIVAFSKRKKMMDIF